jgi:glycosyltransferase involved in cell wall biosynthesis
LAEAGAPAPVDKSAAHLLLCAPASQASNGSKVGFIGPWNYSNGLAVASRGYVSALRHTGLAINFEPIRRPFHIHQQVTPAVDMCDFTGPPDVAIVHLNPDGWSGLLTERQRRTIYEAKLSIGVWVWEMANLPEDWFPFFDQVRAIWAPSRYCADIFSTRARVPIDVIPHVVTVPPLDPDPIRVDMLRRGLGLSEGDRIILYAFDGSSYLVRKNPFALVRSFAQSGLAGNGWRLALKAKHLSDSPVQGELLRQQVERTQGVVLIDRAVSKATMSQLMRTADIYASPHCSEGFGLTIAEAMAMGKLVVATDYSGSSDFLDAECGFPIRYQLRSLDDDCGHYTRDGGVWAHVDEEHFTESLIEAAGLITAGDMRLGDAARRRICDLFSPQAVGAKMCESLSRLLDRG